MADYRINLGIQLNNSDFQNIRNQINGLEQNQINVRLSDRTILRQISNIRQQLQQIGNVGINIGGNLFNGGGRNVNNNIGNITRNVNNNMSQIMTTANNASKTIQRLRQTLASANFDNASMNLVTQHLEQMDLAITRVSSRIRNNNLRLNVTGVDEMGRTVTR